MGNNQTPKILVNPAFVGKVETAEDETERMRAELLQKEKELLALKRQEIDQQIATYKRHMDQNIKPEDSKPSSTTSHSSSQSKVSKKVLYSKYGEISFNLLRIIIKYSNIKYLTDICFNNGLNVNNKTLLQLNIIGQSDQRKSNMT